MFLLHSSEPSPRQARVGSKSEGRKLSLWGPGPEQAIEAKASCSLLVFNATRSLDTVHIAFESKDEQGNWSTDDPCALTRPPPKKSTQPTGDQLTPECGWQRPCLLAKQNAIASSTPSNQKGVSLWLEVPTRCHSAFISHFSNGLDASHSRILKSQVHRECSYLLKMLKTCMSIYAVKVSRTLIIFSQNRNLATAPCHHHAAPAPALHWAPCSRTLTVEPLPSDLTSREILQ